MIYPHKLIYAFRNKRFRAAFKYKQYGRYHIVVKPDVSLTIPKFLWDRLK